MSKELPSDLHAAYDWTDAAGELDELRDLDDSAAETYAAESAANCESEGTGDVSADDLLRLRDWLRSQGDK